MLSIGRLAPLGRMALAAITAPIRLAVVPFSMSHMGFTRTITTTPIVAAARSSSAKKSSSSKPKRTSRSRPTKTKTATAAKKKAATRSKLSSARIARARAAAKNRADKRSERAQRRRARLELQKERRAEQRAHTIAKNRERREHKKQVAAEKREARLASRRARRDHFNEKVKELALKRQKRAADLLARHPTRARRAADPTLPRRPPNAYATFLKDRYKSIEKALAAATPGAKISPPQVARQVAVEWKKLPEGEMADRLKAHQAKVAEYELKKKAHQLQQPPKRPLTGYMRFFVDNHGRISRANPDKKAAEVLALIGSEWRSLPAAEKDSYNSKALAEMNSWKLSMKNWNLAHPQHAPIGKPRPPTLKEISEKIVNQIKKDKESNTKAQLKAKSKRAQKK